MAPGEHIAPPATLEAVPLVLRYLSQRLAGRGVEVLDATPPDVDGSGIFGMIREAVAGGQVAAIWLAVAAIDQLADDLERHVAELHAGVRLEGFDRPDVAEDLADRLGDLVDDTYTCRAVCSDGAICGATFNRLGDKIRHLAALHPAPHASAGLAGLSGFDDHVYRPDPARMAAIDLEHNAAFGLGQVLGAALNYAVSEPKGCAAHTARCSGPAVAEMFGFPVCEYHTTHTEEDAETAASLEYLVASGQLVWFNSADRPDVIDTTATEVPK